MVRFEPRRYLVDPAAFGRDPDATWLPVEPGDEPVVAAALFQHQVVCGIRSRMAEAGDTVADAAARTGSATETLGRKLAGIVPARAEDLYALVFAYGDITVLPAPSSISDLLPATGSDPPAAAR